MIEQEIKVPVLIMGGGTTPAKLQGITTEMERAFIPLLGRSLIGHTIDNIRHCPFISSITIVGNPKRLAEEFKGENYAYFEDTGSLYENLMLGLKELEAHRQVLVMTSDVPLVTGDILASTVDECFKSDAECYYPIVAKNVSERKFPGGERTYVTMKEGQFTGGNVFLISPKAVLRNEHIFQSVIRDRKNPLKLARLFGLSFIFMMLFGMLDIPMLEKKASQILGVKIKAVISPNPEIAFDVDKETDYVQVKRFLEKRRENGSKT